MKYWLLQDGMEDHVKTIASLDDPASDPVAVDQLVIVSGLQAIADVVEEELTQDKTRPVGTLAVGVDPDGRPESIRWVVSTWAGGLMGKFETKKLFPRAETTEPKSKYTTFNFDGATFPFRPDAWTSEWVQASTLRVAFLKVASSSRTSAAGALQLKEAEKFGARVDFLVRASVELTEQKAEAEVVFSGIPTGLDSLDDLPGYASPGNDYPAVELVR